jgi:hypothetical protein
MLEDALDHRPQPDRFALQLAACVPDPNERRAAKQWLRGSNDRANIWTNLRDIEHWIDRARG